MGLFRVNIGRKTKARGRLYTKPLVFFQSRAQGFPDTPKTLRVKSQGKVKNGLTGGCAHCVITTTSDKFFSHFWASRPSRFAVAEGESW